MRLTSAGTPSSLSRWCRFTFRWLSHQSVCLNPVTKSRWKPSMSESLSWSCTRDASARSSRKNSMPFRTSPICWTLPKRVSLLVLAKSQVLVSAVGLLRISIIYPPFKMLSGRDPSKCHLLKNCRENGAHPTCSPLGPGILILLATHFLMRVHLCSGVSALHGLSSFS